MCFFFFLLLLHGLGTYLSFPFLFCYVPFVLIFFSKIVLFPWNPLVCMSSSILSPLPGRFFFIILKCPVLSVLFYRVSITPSFPFFHQFHQVYFLELHFFINLCCFFLFIPACVFCFVIFAFVVISYLCFQLNFSPRCLFFRLCSLG